MLGASGAKGLRLLQRLRARLRRLPVEVPRPVIQIVHNAIDIPKPPPTLQEFLLTPTCYWVWRNPLDRLFIGQRISRHWVADMGPHRECDGVRDRHGLIPR